MNVKLSQIAKDKLVCEYVEMTAVKEDDNVDKVRETMLAKLVK